MFEYYNPNPDGSDNNNCVIRTLTKILNKSWEDVYWELAYKDVLRSKQGYTGGGGGGYFNSRSKTKKKKKKPFLPFSRPLRARKKNDVYRAIKRMKAYERAEHLKKG